MTLIHDNAVVRRETAVAMFFEALVELLKICKPIVEEVVNTELERRSF